MLNHFWELTLESGNPIKEPAQVLLRASYAVRWSSSTVLKIVFYSSTVAQNSFPNYPSADIFVCAETLLQPNAVASNEFVEAYNNMLIHNEFIINSTSSSYLTTAVILLTQMNMGHIYLQ